MNYRYCSDIELLKLLIGEKTALKVYQGSLARLFIDGTKDVDMYPKIVAVQEIMQRALGEELKHRDALSSPSMVRDYLRVLLSGKEHEVFVVIFLDAQNRVLEAEELFRGTLTQTSVYPREVVKSALKANAASLIFAHNHPSGIAEPSHADQLLTQALKQALALVDVKVLDHFIVAGNACLSFAERGLI